MSLWPHGLTHFLTSPMCQRSFSCLRRLLPCSPQSRCHGGMKMVCGNFPPSTSSVPPDLEHSPSNPDCPAGVPHKTQLGSGNRSVQILLAQRRPSWESRKTNACDAAFSVPEKGRTGWAGCREQVSLCGSAWQGR